MNDFVEEVKPTAEINKKPDCEAPGCDMPSRGALINVAGKWVCGDCAMKKHGEINKRVWS